MQPPEFALRREWLAGGGLVIAVRGEIDLFTAPELKSALTEAIDADVSRIVVDLTETGFLDSTALGVLIGALRRLRAGGGRLTVVNVDESIAKTFAITSIDQMLKICPTRAEAVAALDEATA